MSDVEWCGMDNVGAEVLTAQSRSDKPRISRYVEIDFPHMTSLKAQRIARSPKLRDLLTSSPKDQTTSASTPASSAANAAEEKSYTISKGGTQLSSPIYTLLPLDLRQSPSRTLTREVLPLLDPSVPTLFLAECVFCYLMPEVGGEIINWFSERFESCMGVIYEMCGLELVPSSENFPELGQNTDFD